PGTADSDCRWWPYHVQQNAVALWLEHAQAHLPSLRAAQVPRSGAGSERPRLRGAGAFSTIGPTGVPRRSHARAKRVRTHAVHAAPPYRYGSQTTRQFQDRSNFPGPGRHSALSRRGACDTVETLINATGHMTLVL